jgi:hypothetical protein
MRVPRQAFAWATAAALLGCPAATAFAADPGPDTLPINVIAIQTDDADDQAEALTKALRNAVRAMPGWSLGAGDYSFAVLALSLKCPDPPDANCQSRIADQIKTDRYIWGTMKKKKGGNVVGELHLWVRGKGTSNLPIEYTSNLTEANEDALRKIATDAVNNLTGGPPKGSVHIKAGQVNGQVFVDGQPIGALKGGDGTFLVPSGQHKLTVKAVGFADAESLVTIKPTGAATELSLTLAPSQEKSNVNVKLIGGIASLGVGVAFGVVGLVAGLQVKSAQSEFDEYRRDQPESRDMCKNATGDAASLCSKGKTFQTLELVAFPVAAVAAGVGIFLIATSRPSAPKQPTTGFTFDPQVGPTGGKLGVTYTF